MNQLQQVRIHCPYCGEPLDILLDPSEEGDAYIEDCQVCCRPIVMTPNIDGSGVTAHHEDDAY